MSLMRTMCYNHTSETGQEASCLRLLNGQHVWARGALLAVEERTHKTLDLLTQSHGTASCTLTTDILVFCLEVC